VSLFVAVILDNLELDEDIKRLKQVRVQFIFQLFPIIIITTLLLIISISSRRFH